MAQFLVLDYFNFLSIAGLAQNKLLVSNNFVNSGDGFCEGHLDYSYNVCTPREARLPVCVFRCHLFVQAEKFFVFTQYLLVTFPPHIFALFIRFLTHGSEQVPERFEAFKVEVRMHLIVGRHARRIVDPPFLLVAECLVGFVDLNVLMLGVLVFVNVGMVLLG